MTASPVLAVAALAALLLAGCTAQPAASPTHTPAPTSPTTPTATPQADPVQAFADQRLASMTLKQKVASLFMLHYPGTAAAPIRRFVEKYQPGGLILMGDNIPPLMSALKKQVAAISPDPELPLLTGIDQEGGIVRRILLDSGPAGAELRNKPASVARSAFATRAAYLQRAGIAINFGIVADETADPASFIFPRVLGTTPQAAADRVAAAVKGERGEVLSTLKHFPGHGISAADSHASIPSTTMTLSRWTATHAVPFQAGVDAGAEVVMFGHLQFSRVDNKPATLSKKWHDILRDKLGFQGITITDDMLMLQRSGNTSYRSATRNAITAIAAGNTMLLYVLPAQPKSVGFEPAKVVDAVVAAVRDGRISEATIDADARKLIVARRSLVLG
ncbi:MAG: glycoside hydrolase family 3 protein [Glaciihabitans sp.]|nr:glycoside hydrolase family 3 protein [Glaciihabitans sp.]